MTEISYQSLAKKKQLIRIVSYAIIIVLFALYWFSGHSDKPDSPQKSNTLSISGPWEISSLEPSKQGYLLSRMQTIETLLNVDAEGNIIAGLASDWQVSDDGLEWLLSLRPNVIFHDGSNLDAAAAVNSLNYAMNTHSVLNKASIKQIEALNDTQVRIRLNQAYNAFAALLSHYSTAILAPASYNADGKVATLYGSGPYQMETFAPPHKLLVKQFADYWGQNGSIAYATYLTGHRAESRILQAKSGEADIVFTIDPSMLSQLEGSENVQIHSNLIPRTLFIKLNSGHPLLSEVKVRQALTMALNRSAIAKNVLHTEGAETAQLLPSSMSQWHIAELANDEYDLAKAKSLMAELGWQAGANGGLVKDGQAFELSMLTYADRPELATVATAIQAQWAELGVKLKVDITNSSMIPAGHSDGSLETALIARNFGFIADPLPIISSDFANGGGDWGTMNWHNSAVDSAIAELLQTHDESLRYQLSQTVAKAIQQDYPAIPITNYSQHTAVNQRVKNFRFDPFERDYFINQMEID